MKTKRFIAIMLTVMLLVSLIPMEAVPVMAEGDAHEIGSTEDWDAFAAAVSEGTADYSVPWVLTADITVSTPVGTKEHPFAGVFDGNGHTLNAAIKDTGQQGTALFRYIGDAEIKNLTVTGQVVGTYHAAGLVGLAWSGENTISNCTVNTTVEVYTGVYRHMGGVVGANSSTTFRMSDVVFGGALKNSEDFIGGLVGWSTDSSIYLTDCLFKGTQTGEGYFHPILCKSLYSNVTAEFTRVYYTVEPNFSDSDCLVDGAGVPISPDVPENKMFIPVTAADGQEYYGPCSVEGLRDVYMVSDDSEYVVKNVYGETMTEGEDYTVSFMKDGVIKRGFNEAGTYALTFSGIGAYQGSETFDISVAAYNWSFEKDEGRAVGWTFADQNGDGKNWGYVTNSKYARSGAGDLQSADFPYQYDRTPDDWAITPLIKIPEKKAVLSFWAAVYYNEGSVKMAVYIGDSPDDLESMVKIGGDYTVSGGYTHYTIDLGGYAGKEKYIAFRHFGKTGGNGGGLCLDDVSVGGESIFSNKARISRTDAADGTRVSGARLQIINSEGKVAADWVSDNEIYLAMGLKSGTYTIKEIEAPKGYYPAEDLTFTIDENGEVSTDGITDQDGSLVMESEHKPVYEVKLTSDPSAGGTVTADDSAPTEGDIVTLTVIASKGYRLEKLAYTQEGGTGETEIERKDGKYSFVMPAANVSVTAVFNDRDPYTISSREEWEAFAAAVNDGAAEYTKTWALTANITIKTSVGTEEHPFKGVFEGNGHTLVAEIDDTSAQGTAPFRYIADAEIRDLNVTGYVTGGHHTAGLVGFNWSGESTISNCNVSAIVVDNSYEEVTYIGGVVGHNKSSILRMDRTVFDGRMSWNKGIAGGFVGWSDSSQIYLTDCLFNGFNFGAYNFHPIACKADEAEVSGKCVNVYFTKGAELLGPDILDMYQGSTVYEEFPEAEAYCLLKAVNFPDMYLGSIVYKEPPEDEVYRLIKAADGKTYYEPCRFNNLRDKYTINTAPQYTAVFEEDQVLTEGVDYTAVFKKDGKSCSGLYNLGQHELVISGTGDFCGSATFPFTVVPYYSGFEEDEDVEGWTTQDHDDDGREWEWADLSRLGNYAAGPGMISLCFDMDELISLTPDNWLLSPRMMIPGDAELSFMLLGYPTECFDKNVAVYIGDTKDIDSMEKIADNLGTSAENPFIVLDLSEYAGQEKYIALRHYNVSSENIGVAVDEFKLTGSQNVLISESAIGKVTIDRYWENVGDTVTLTVSDLAGGELCVSYKDYKGQTAKAPVTKESDGTYTFKMPENPATVKVMYPAAASFVREDVTMVTLSGEETVFEGTTEISADPGEMITVSVSLRDEAAKCSLMYIYNGEEGPVTKEMDVSRNGASVTGRFTMPAAGVTVAVATRSYEAVFDSNGGSTVETQCVSNGCPVVKPADPVKEGSWFLGWYRVKDGVTAEDAYDFENSRLTENITLRAKWEPARDPAFKTQSLLLSGKIGVVFFMDLPQQKEIDYADRESCYMEFTVSGKDGDAGRVYFDPQYMNPAGRYYGFTCYVNSIQMADTITAVFHYTENGEAKTLEKTYSVRQYLEAVAAGNYPDRLKALCAAIGDYGYWAQQYLSVLRGWKLGEDADHAPMPEGTAYTEDDLAEALRAAEEYRFSLPKNEAAGLGSMYYSLVLDSDTGINLYLKKAAGYDGEIEAFVGDSTENAAVLQKDGRYLVKITGISAHELGSPVRVTVSADGETVLDVSALSYVYMMLNAGSGSGNGKKAVTALYKYYEKTREYMIP